MNEIMREALVVVKLLYHKGRMKGISLIESIFQSTVLLWLSFFAVAKFKKK